MKILISAAEASSDAHGAELLKAIREELGSADQVEAFGVGGPLLQAAGLRAVVDARELLSMGFIEIFWKLPKIFKTLKQLTLEAKKMRPDVAVVIDYPGFHFRLARRLYRLGIPVVYYIPPKVWVWKTGRIEFLKKYFRKILCIFPFEEEFYRQRGATVHYVGNPLLGQLPLALSRAEARRQLNLSSNAKVLLLMAGSRPSELKSHFMLMLQAAHQTALELRRLHVLSEQERLLVLIPFSVSTDSTMTAQLQKQFGTTFDSTLEVRISVGDSAVCMVAADGGLVKSGTSTLEAALMGCPHVLLYKTHWTTYWIFVHLIRYRGPVGLVNRIMDQKLVREMLQHEVTAQNLAAEAVRLITDQAYRDTLKTGFVQLRKIMGVSEAGVQKTPSHEAARHILQMFPSTRYLNAQSTTRAPVQAGTQILPSWLVLSASFLWSCTSAIMRWMRQWGWVRPTQLTAGRVISVGNLQAGGSGKTPVVAKIAHEAFSQGLRVCILIRGYQSTWEAHGGVIVPGQVPCDPILCGDEAALLQELCPFAWIGVGADRISCYRSLTNQVGIFDVVLLDDGFQNWKVKKDVEVVLVTAANRRSTVFRDFLGALKFADWVVFTKGGHWKQLPASVQQQLTGHSVMHSVLTLDGRPIVDAQLGNVRAWLITGVADPQNVYRDLTAHGVSVVKHLSLRDHYAYQISEVRQWLMQAKQDGACVFVTGKDAVKWRALGVEQSAFQVLEPQFQFQEGESGWSNVLWKK